MAYGKKYMNSDKRRGAPLQKEEYSKYGVKDMDKKYQAPSTKYTDGKMKDTKQPPPSKPKQKYGSKGKAELSLGNKNFRSEKGKGIKSIADIRKYRKMKYGY